MKLNKFTLILSTALIGFMLIAVVLASLQVQREESQDDRGKAAPGDTATIDLSPANGSYTVSPDFSSNVIQIRIQTNTSVSAINARLAVPKNNTSPLEPMELIPDNVMQATGWSYNFYGIDSTSDPNNYYLNLSMATTQVNGVFFGSPTPIASFKLRANSATTQPINISFNTNQSTVTAFSDNQAITLTANSGTYQSTVPTPTPTITPIPPTPTNTPVPPTPTRTPTPTTVPPTPTRTPTPTSVPPTPTRTPTPTPIVVQPTNTPVPTPTPTPTPYVFRVYFRLQGITNIVTTNPDATITLVRNGQIVNQQTVPAEALLVSGAYRGFKATVFVPSLPTPIDSSYTLYIKSHAHLRRAIPFSAYQTTAADTGETNVWVANNSGSLELIAGDVDNSNTITIFDLAAIIKLYTNFKVSVAPGTMEDINRDGFVSLVDLALAIYNYQDFIVSGQSW